MNKLYFNVRIHKVYKIILTNTYLKDIGNYSAINAKVDNGSILLLSLI